MKTTIVYKDMYSGLKLSGELVYKDDVLLIYWVLNSDWEITALAPWQIESETKELLPIPFAYLCNCGGYVNILLELADTVLKTMNKYEYEEYTIDVGYI